MMQFFKLLKCITEADVSINGGIQCIKENNLKLQLGNGYEAYIN